MTPLRNLWILEDEPGARFVYSEILQSRFGLSFFPDLTTISQALEKSTDLPDLLVADLRLPEGSFLSFLESEANRRRLRFPFLVVSSLTDLEILQSCFELGAVDYLTKPFHHSEILVKIERILRGQTSYRAPDVFGEVSVDTGSLRARRGEQFSQPLTGRELQILSVFLKAPHQSVSRGELALRVWREVSVGPKTLDVHLFYLRRKLAPLGVSVVAKARHVLSLRVN